MLNKKIVLCSLLLLSLGSVPSHALFISFDEINDPGCCTFLDSYRGLTWSGSEGNESWVASEEAAGLFPGAQAYSGENFAWNNGGADLSIEAGGDDFHFLNFQGRTGNERTALGPDEVADYDHRRMQAGKCG